MVSWGSSLEYLNYDADIVFIGDSITRWHNFNEDYPDKAVVNLGVSGDSLAKIKDRVFMLSYVKPEKIFVMGGINSLKSNSIDEQLDIYESIIKEIKDLLPESNLYVQSTLPISEEKTDIYTTNETIKEFNDRLKIICDDNNITFIDLWSLYEEDGHIKQDTTLDGVHLKPENYKDWTDEIKQYIY